MNSKLSKETIELLSGARLCAIDLGVDYISTVHLLLADCKRDGPYSIKDFVFQTPENFQEFYDSQRINESSFFDSVVTGSLPITLEMEQTIRSAQKLYKKPLMPYHLFLAASQLKETLFYSVLEPKDGLHERLVNFYAVKGISITSKTRKKSFWQWFTTNKSR